MTFKIWHFDGFTVYWTDGEERSGDRMEFNTLEDAIWAQMVWQNFERGEPGEPILRTHDSGNVEVLLER